MSTHASILPGNSTRFRASLFSQALVLVTDFDSFRPLNRLTSVSVRRVLADAWNDFRLERARRRLAAGESAPPISVVRHWLHGQPYYVVSDGNHRTIAARDAGRCRIRAHISSEATCTPTRFVLDSAAGRLWERTDSPCLRLVKDALNDDLMTLLVAIGVAPLPP